MLLLLRGDRRCSRINGPQSLLQYNIQKNIFVPKALREVSPSPVGSASPSVVLWVPLLPRAHSPLQIATVATQLLISLSCLFFPFLLSSLFLFLTCFYCRSLVRVQAPCSSLFSYIFSSLSPSRPPTPPHPFSLSSFSSLFHHLPPTDQNNPSPSRPHLLLQIPDRILR